MKEPEKRAWLERVHNDAGVDDDDDDDDEPDDEAAVSQRCNRTSRRKRDRDASVIITKLSSASADEGSLDAQPTKRQRRPRC